MTKSNDELACEAIGRVVKLKPIMFEEKYAVIEELAYEMVNLAKTTQDFQSILAWLYFVEKIAHESKQGDKI